ncbi:MAG: SDR family NAD(P)-dependent oxidoreductase [Anaerolineales bacterium]
MNMEELTALYDFSGRTVVVTGGAGVLGSVIAGALLGCNANVVLLDLNQELAHEAIDRFPEAVRERTSHVFGNVLEIETLHQADETVRNRFGAVDILVNAAGGNHPSATTSPDLSFFDLPLDALRHVGDLNLLGTILPCQVFGRGMAERGEGVILNISSMNAFRPLTRIPAYSAAKAAINRGDCVDRHPVSPHPNLINCIRLLPASDSAVCRESASAFVTGAVIPIDGGFSAYSGV